MQQHSVGRQTKSITLHRGLYLLTYKAAKQVQAPPTATVQVDGASIEAILPPGQFSMTLGAPGATMVLRVQQTSQIGIELIAGRPGASMEAEFTCEPISPAGVAATPEPAAPERLPVSSQSLDRSYPRATDRNYAAPAPPGPAFAGDGIRILAHVAKLGDVTVEGDQWLAGPASPARIEGFEIHWPRQPFNVSLRYAAIVQGQPSMAPIFVGLGEFAGTRRQARPILGVVFELSGPGAANFELSAEALFLGSPPRRVSGGLVNFRGPTGREPLIGLRIAITDSKSAQFEQWPAAAVHAPVAPLYAPVVQSAPAPIAVPVSEPPPRAPPPNRRPPAGGGRVRVFRG